ncbi:MAG TPA: glycosyltransferase [Steroidobacteraceae bacterium]|nr:glycosyltransferase [Steroidobacteraceae bacterium]
MLSGEFPPRSGGIADYTSRLASALEHSGCSVQVVTQDETGGQTRDGPYAVRSWSVGGIRAVSGAIRRFGADVVHIQYQTAAFQMNPTINFLPLLLRLNGVRAPVVTTFHDFRAPFLFRGAGAVRPLANHLLVGFSSAVLFTDPADLLRAHPRRPAAWIPIGPNLWPSPGHRTPIDQARAWLGLPLGVGVVCYFGFLNHSKGVDTLIESIRLLADSGRNIRLLLIGDALGSSDPSNRETLGRVNADIERLGLQDHVMRSGPLLPREVSTWLAASDCAALPFVDGASLRRGSLLACLAHAIPVVSTFPEPMPRLADRWLVAPFCNQEEYRLSGAELALVRPGDSHSLAGTIGQLLDSPPEAHAMGLRGRALAERLGWPRIADATMSMYERALSANESL